METKIIESRKKIDNIGVTKSRFFEKITKVDKPLTRLMGGKKKKKEKERQQKWPIWNERGAFITDYTDN